MSNIAKKSDDQIAINTPDNRGPVEKIIDALFFGGVERVRELPPPRALFPGVPDREKVSGYDLITLEHAARAAAEEQNGGKGVFFGGIKAPEKSHFILCGQNRSGKTVLMRQTMAQVISEFGNGSGKQAIIYDPSGELVSFIYGLREKFFAERREEVPIYILNPLDTRCVSWDVLRDIKTFSQAYTLARLLFPEEKRNTSDASKYFNEASAAVLASVIYALILNDEERVKRGLEPLRPTLKDAFLVMGDMAKLEALLTAHFETRDVWTYFLGDQNRDLMGTLWNQRVKFVPIAQLWHDRDPISLKEKLQSRDSCIIILSNDPERTEITTPLNNFILNRYIQLALSNTTASETDLRRWLFIDEFPALGELQQLKNVIARGVKKGVRLLSTFQSLQQIQEVYGDESASSILSETAFIGFLRLQHKAAEAASEFFGKVVYNQPMGNAGQTFNFTQPSQSSIGYSMQRIEEPLITHDRFGFEPAGRKNGISGYFYGRDIGGVYRHQFTWREVEEYASLEHVSEPNFSPRPEEDERLTPSDLSGIEAKINVSEAQRSQLKQIVDEKNEMASEEDKEEMLYRKYGIRRQNND